MSYIASQISADDVHINYFHRRFACEVELSSTSQASRRSMPGTDYVSAINVHICRSFVPGRSAAYEKPSLKPKLNASATH